MTPSLRMLTLDNPAEDEAVRYMRTVVSPTRDQIRDRINQLTPIPTVARLVLIEVCNLVELAGKGQCWASNETLAGKAACHFKSVSRHLQTLDKAGLLTCKYGSKSKASRYLIPSEQTLAVCDGADPSELILRLKLVSWSDAKAPERLAGWMERTAPRDGAYCSEGMERSAPCMERSAPQIDITKENNKEELLSSMVAELQSALDAANAAHQEKEAELALLIEGLEKRIENGILKFKAQELELAGFRTASLAIVTTKPAKAPRQKSALHSFADSPYALVATVEAALAGTDYEHADIAYYHEVIYNWATSKGERRADWLGTIRNAIIKDSKEGKLKLNPNSQLIPTQHDKQQQSAYEQRHGLVDRGKIAASLAFSLASGI